LRLPVHTPYKNGDGGVKVGLEPIDHSDWLEVDDLFKAEIKQKKILYALHSDQVHCETSNSKESQSELLEILKTHLKTYYPDHNFLDFDSSSLLQKASMMVQEDLVLMIPDNGKYFLGAASLCAPSNWSLKEKFNKSLIDIHEYVPSYAKKIGSKVDNLFIKLPTDRIFQRFNWSIYENSSLFQPAKSKTDIERSSSIKGKNAGDKLFLRVERQTIRRLPKTLSIIFTIRVHIDPLSSIQTNISLLRDLNLAIENLSNEMKVYKSIDQIEKPLKDWLNRRINELL